MPLICIITIKFVVITDLSMDAHLIIWCMVSLTTRSFTSTHSPKILFVQRERERESDTRVYLNCKGVRGRGTMTFDCVCVAKRNSRYTIHFCVAPYYDLDVCAGYNLLHILQSEVRLCLKQADK